MHHDQVDLGIELIRRLLASQVPELAGLPLNEVPSTGTVNAIYRLGEALYVRMPRVARWAPDLEKELRWLPRLARQLPLPVPEPVHRGQPQCGYPFRWAVYRWLPGETFGDDRVEDAGEAANELAKFIIALRGVDRRDAPRSRRGRPLAVRDHEARAAIASSRHLIDADAVTAAWDASLRAPEWEGDPVWTHGDLLRPNLLVRNGRLSAILDFGNIGIGDPAIDVIAAWTIFDDVGRRSFRAALEVDDTTWSRARGLALHQALMIIPYYFETNPGFVASAQRTVEQVIAEADV
jgi:aminoglycoside phosphotransferase (APT) family kinase protein